MPVSTTNAQSGPFVGNGVNTVFPFTFTAQIGADVGVLVNNVAVSSGLYSVALTEGGGGSVTFTTAPANAASVVLILNPSFTQETEFIDGVKWKADPVNAGFDRSALRDQVLLRDLNRAPKVPLGETIGNFPSAAVRANKYLVFNDSGGISLAANGATNTNGISFFDVAYTTISTLTISQEYIRLKDRGGAIFKRSATEPTYNVLAKAQDAAGTWYGLWLGQIVTPWMFGATEEPWLTYDGVSSQNAIQRFFDFISDNLCLGADVSGDFRTDGPVRLSPTSETGYVKTANIEGLMRLRGGIYVTNDLIPIGRVNANKAVLSIDNLYPYSNGGGYIVSALGGADYNIRLNPCCIRLGAVGRAQFTTLEGENAQIWSIWATDQPGVKNSNLMGVNRMRGIKGGSGLNFAGRSHSGTVGSFVQYGVAGSNSQRARIALSLFADLPPAALEDYKNGASRDETDIGGYLAGSSPIFIKFTSGPNNGKIFHVTHVNYAGAAIMVYPWPSSATAAGNTFRWIFGGGVCLSGADTNIWTIGSIEASNCGIGLSCNMFYGPQIGLLHTDADGIGVHFGANNDNSSFSTDIDSAYFEGVDTQILTTSRNCDANITTIVGLDLALVDSTVNAASALGVRGVDYPNLQRVKIGRVDGHSITGYRPTSNLIGSTSTLTINRNDQIEIVEADTRTMQVGWVAGLNLATGIDSMTVHVYGSGASRQPTGTITFTPDPANVGLTINGAASAAFAAHTKPAHFIIKHEVATNNLEVVKVSV